MDMETHSFKSLPEKIRQILEQADSKGKPVSDNTKAQNLVALYMNEFRGFQYMILGLEKKHGAAFVEKIRKEAQNDTKPIGADPIEHEDSEPT